MPLLQGVNVSKFFGGLAAVKNVNFRVEREEILGLIGPNGSGKTTLFNLITGVYTPSSGIIEFEGENITGLRPYKLAKKGISRTFQSIKPFHNMTVFENVVLGALYKKCGISWRDAKRRAYELLERVGLVHKANALVGELNIIELKRLEIARALSLQPKILLLDEIMAGLTPSETLELLDFLKKLREERITLFVIEHNIKAIMNLCDRIMVLHHGEKIADGTPKEIVADNKVIEAYLGSPLP